MIAHHDFDVEPTTFWFEISRLSVDKLLSVNNLQLPKKPVYTPVYTEIWKSW